MADLLLQLLRGLLQMLSGTSSTPTASPPAADVVAGHESSIDTVSEIAPDLDQGAWLPTCGRSSRTRARQRIWVHTSVFLVTAVLMAWLLYLELSVAVAVLALAYAGLVAYVIAERILGPGNRPGRNRRRVV